MILAAGFGKRLHPLTLRVPKPLVAVNGRPILDYTLDHLTHGEIQRCIVNTHYLAQAIHEHLHSVHHPHITLSYEPQILDTGGAIRHVLPFFKDQPFFVVNADIWWEEKSVFDRLREMWDPERMDGILVVVPYDQAIDFPGSGDYFLTDDQKLAHRGDKSEAPYIYSGIQLLHPRVFQNLPEGPFPLLDLYLDLEQKGRLYGLVMSGSWCDMGTPQTLANLECHLQS